MISLKINVDWSHLLFRERQRDISFYFQSNGLDVKNGTRIQNITLKSILSIFDVSASATSFPNDIILP